ncbi:MAG: YsnF/AvaK domain-containing protein [Thermoproteota archaeon]|nr:YsnF/AvaK domain-containing protein [Thermoproteota archaeon]
MSREQGIDWDDVIKKEARGINDEDLGEVHEVGDTYVLVQKGLINKEKYYVPQNEVESYDGNILRFKLSEEEIKSKYSGDSPPLTRNTEKDDGEEESESTHVSLVEERLNISKRDVTYKEATLIKEPVTETKTVEVPITHEELVVERRPASKSTTSTSDLKPPVTSKEEIKIPLKKEEVEVKKEPYVKEEVVLKKKRITETKTITEEVKSERLADTSGIDVE